MGCAPCKGSVIAVGEISTRQPCRWPENYGCPIDRSRAKKERPETGQESVQCREIGRTPRGSIHNQELLLHETVKARLESKSVIESSEDPGQVHTLNSTVRGNGVRHLSQRTTRDTDVRYCTRLFTTACFAALYSAGVI